MAADPLPALIAQIKDRVDALDLIGRTVHLSKHGTVHKGLCPFHDEKTPSFTVFDDGHYKCFGCAANGDVIDFVSKRDQIPFPEAVNQLAREHGLEIPNQKREKQEVACRYDYLDADGNLLYQVERLRNPKGFRQRRPDGDGHWVWGLGAGWYERRSYAWGESEDWTLFDRKLQNGDPSSPPAAGVRWFPEVPRVLYRLPEVLAAAAKGLAIFVPEGERDVDNLSAAGVAATCNPQGAGDWRLVDQSPLAGAHLVVLPDNDGPARKQGEKGFVGQHHAQDVAARTQPLAASVRVLDLASRWLEMPEKGDVSDWLAAGHDATSLRQLARGCQVWEPGQWTDPEVSAGKNGHHEAAGLNGKAPPSAGAPPGEDVDAKLQEWGWLNLTEMGNAERLVRAHGDSLRYFRQRGEWLEWDGTRWAEDGTFGVFRKAKEVVRSIAAEAEHIRNEDVQKAIKGWAKASESGDRLNSMVKMARYEPAITVVNSALDQDPWLLNCRSGTIDLRTGELRSHRREDLITEICPTIYDPQAECPELLKFLHRSLAEDAEMVAYLQRLMGFALTGIPADRVMWFFHGGGGNGKSTFLSVFHELLAGYARKAAAESLMVRSQGPSIPNDLAELRGARLVTSAELSQGLRLNEARLKDLTGRDIIKARFLNQEFFEYRPQFKLFMYGNHKPVIRGTDEGIWDRLKLVPWTVTIPEGEKDTRLPEKLSAELSGILAWAVRGCLSWQQIGFAHPEKVKAATQKYRAEEDPLADFLGEKTIRSPHGEVNNPDIWGCYTRWCDMNGEKYPLGRKPFSQRLEELGFVQHRTSLRRYWVGLELVDEEPIPQEDEPERRYGVDY